MSGYIGNIPTPQATQTRDVFTATAGQTSFATSGYTPGFLDVYLNGVHLVNGTDYTASNGSDVVLSSGATAGDTLSVVAFTTFVVSAGTEPSIPLGAIIPIRQGLTGSYPIPASGTVDAKGFMYCDGSAIPSGNAVSGNTPDLTDGRFLRGSTSSGSTGGSTSFTLSTVNLPSHTHTGTTASGGSHSHTASTATAGSHTHSGSANSAGAHQHGVERPTGTSTIPNNSNINRRMVLGLNNSAGAHTHTLSINSGGDHTHTVTVDSGGAHTHTFTTDATGSGTAVTHIPTYFDVVYLMRVN